MFHFCNYSCCKIARYYFWRKLSCHIWRRRVNVRMKLNAAILGEKGNFSFFPHEDYQKEISFKNCNITSQKTLCKVCTRHSTVIQLCEYQRTDAFHEVH